MQFRPPSQFRPPMPFRQPTLFRQPSPLHQLTRFHQLTPFHPPSRFRPPTPFHPPRPFHQPQPIRRPSRVLRQRPRLRHDEAPSRRHRSARMCRRRWRRSPAPRSLEEPCATTYSTSLAGGGAWCCLRPFINSVSTWASGAEPFVERFTRRTTTPMSRTVALNEFDRHQRFAQRNSAQARFAKILHEGQRHQIPHG